jgi:molybdate transport system permease protein
MESDTWQIIRLSVGVASLSTLVILPFAVSLAWWLARYDWPGKSLVETLVSLPLVIPPVATGLILLGLMGRKGLLGDFLYEVFGLEIVFTWKAVVLAARVMSFPLLVRSTRSAFEEVDSRLEQIAQTLGAGRWRVFFTITIPLAARGIIGGSVLAFARALGEFGATILVAGNIPGETATLSLSIYSLVELGKDTEAFRLMMASIAIAFVAVWMSEWILRSKTSSRRRRA